MRILLHDYAGHPFQADLSRQLARRGHTVLHASCASFPAPKGRLMRAEGDPPGLEFVALEMSGFFSKYAFFSRWKLEREYGRRLCRLIREWRPEVLLLSTTPLDPMTAAFACCERQGIATLFWLQDIYSVAIGRYLGERWGWVGRLIGWRYGRLERRLARRASAVVAITEGFLPTLRAWGVEEGRVTVQPNWAPLADIPPLPRHNAWAEEQGLGERSVLLYAGTLGLKHDPELLAGLAAGFVGWDDVVVVVVTEGWGADWLREERRRRGLGNLLLLPFQPVERVAEMLASADVLLSSLEPGAGVFSVPSKILAQLCAGRALLASIPAENDAARMIVAADAGRVVAPGDYGAWLEAARELVAAPDVRERLGANARRFAEGRFDSERIAADFERIITRTLRSREAP